MTTGWEVNLVETADGAVRILKAARRIAVLGIKTEAHAGQPAFFVPDYLQNAGYDIVPVPVYYPEAREILGQPIYRSVSAIPEPVDLVLVFRRSRDVPTHVPDLLAARPHAVWLQSGIRSDSAARELAAAGIQVVQDRCAMVDHRRVRLS